MGWRALRPRKEEPATSTTEPGVGILAVAGVTVANGADNVTAYVPFFASRKPWESAVTLFVFATMTAVWCIAAHRLVHHPTLGAPLRRCGSAILPFVLVALGAYLFVDAGAHEVVIGVFR